jgi:hypothetical protein
MTIMKTAQADGAKGGLLSTQERLLRGVLAFVLAGGVVLIFLVPAENLQFSFCWFRELTGASCLTCGMSRSLHAASRGELLTAFQYHAAGPFLLCGMLGAVVIGFGEAILGKRSVPFRSTRSIRPAAVGFLSVWIVYGIVRAVVELA